MTFHVLFIADGGPIQECEIEATCLLECEDRLRELHPEAVRWEIGLGDRFLRCLARKKSHESSTLMMSAQN